MSDKIHIVIADDHTLFRDGLATIINAEPDLEVVGQAGNKDEAVQLARDLLPDIALLDIDMPGGGLEAARVIAEQYPVTRIAILTASEEDDHLIGALKTGARWRDLPPDFGVSPATCWRRLRRWEEQEVWVKVWRRFLAELDQ